MDNSVAECELVNVKKRPKEEEFHNVSSLFYLCAFCGGQLKNWWCDEDFVPSCERFQWGDCSVGLLGAHNVCSRTHTLVRSLSCCCFFFMGSVEVHVLFCFVCFFPYLSSFNIHMHIPSHKVQNPGLVKAVVPLNRYFILLYFLTNKRSVHCDQVWQIQETGTQWCACLYTMNIDHVNWFHMVPPKIRICKSSWLM